MLTLPIVLFYILGVLGLSKNLRNLTLDKVIDLAGLVTKGGDLFKDNFLDKVFPQASAKLMEPETIQKPFNNAFSSINKFFENGVESLRNHATSIVKRLEKNDDLRAWRIFGYFFQLTFLCLFAYADLIQLNNSLAVIFPQEVSQNPLFNNLAIALLITSVGTAIAASFIIAEFAEVTSFGRWHEIKSPFLKGTIHFLTWFALILIIIIDIVIGLSRITASPEIATLLDEPTKNSLILAANFAQALVIVPLLIITFLFLGGVVGVAVLYVILVWAISFLIQLLHLVFVGVLWLLIFGVAYLFQVVIRLILWIVTAALFVFGWVFFGVGETLVKLLEVGKKLLDVIYFPMDALVGWLLSYIEKSGQKQAKPMK